MVKGGSRNNYRTRSHLRANKKHRGDSEIDSRKEEYEERYPDAKRARGRSAQTDSSEYFRRVCKTDFGRLMSLPSFIDPQLKYLLAPQSLAGRANQGHGGFGERCYPDATTEDVLKALDISWKTFWAKRQMWIDDIKVWVRRAVRDPSDPRVRRLYSTDGKRALAGYSYVQELDSNEQVLEGLAALLITTSMDTFDPFRIDVQKKYGIHMGGGDCVAVSMPALKENNLSLTRLSSVPHSKKKLQSLIDKGVVLDVPSIGTSDIVRNGYVRRQRGKGVSDDGELIACGWRYGPHGFHLGMCSDFIDTLDKSVAEIIKGGQDGALGDEIRTNAKERGLEIPVTDDEIVDMIYLAAIDPVRPTHWAHCSQRYFYQNVDGRCAAQISYRFSQDLRSARNWNEARELANNVPYQKLGFGGVSSRTFYTALLRRMKDAEKKGIITVF